MAKQAEYKAVARQDISYWEYTKREMKRNWIAYVMILPYVVIFALFTLCPVVLSFIVGFTDFNMLQWPNFVWIENYVNLFFADDIFIIACKNTLIFATIVGPTSYIMSFLVAWFINELPPRIRAVITLIFYAPSISGGIYTIWGTLFDADTYGWVNATLIEIGIIQDPIAWFKDADYIMPLCIAVSLWMSLYEAGAVDGIRNRWQELWFITLPSMKPQLMFNAILTITGAFGYGGVVSTLCGFPSVDYAAHTITHHLDDYGGARYEIGYASAIATVLFAIQIFANRVISKALSKVGT